jgi:hypothetical protein
MVFPATNHADHLLKNEGVHGRCENPSSGMNGAEEKPRLVFRIKLPPAHNRGKMLGKVIKDRADEKPVPTLSSSMNCVEKKPPLVFKIKLPPSHNKEKLSFKAKSGKDEKLVPITSGSISMGNGSMNSCLKNTFSCRPKKLASSVVTKDRSDKKLVPTSCAAKKAYGVTRVKLPTPYNKGIELNGGSGNVKKLVPMASSGMSGTDGKKDQRLIKIKMPALRQNKEQLNIRKTVVQQTRFINGSSAIPKTTDKSCLGKPEIDEELFELKLEATKRKLHQRYQQAQNTKRKIQLLDFQDIPKPENVTKRPKRS